MKVFVYEEIDPTRKSLSWLEGEGVELDPAGVHMWGHPPVHLPDDLFLERARHSPALMGSSSQKLSADVIAELPGLRYIAKFGIGVDNIDLGAATRAGILVTNTPVASEVEAVAEHTIALLLGLMKRLDYWTPDFIRAGGWRSAHGWAGILNGSTVGFVGYGRIARAVQQRLQGWGCEFAAYDPFAQGREEAVRWCSLEELLSTADVVAIHAVATASNAGLINTETLQLMKPGALLINTARGSLVNLDDLHLALQQKRLAGAALDVFEEEPPPPDHPLFRLPRVLVTPHASAWNEATLAEMGWTGARNLLQMLRGEVPRNLVNRDVVAQSG